MLSDIEVVVLDPTPEDEELGGKPDEICHDTIYMTIDGTEFESMPEDLTHTTIQRIVQAANEKRIPVYKPEDESPQPRLAVSEHVREPEKYPEIFLQALEAYAQSLGREDAASLASDQIQTLQSMREALDRGIGG